MVQHDGVRGGVNIKLEIEWCPPIIRGLLNPSSLVFFDLITRCYETEVSVSLTSSIEYQKGILLRP